MWLFIITRTILFLNPEQQDDSMGKDELVLFTSFCQIFEGWDLDDEINWYDAGRVISVGDGIVMA